MTPAQAVVRPIIHEVCAERGLTYDEIVNPGRRSIVILARREVWRRIHALGYGPMDISRAWGCTVNTIVDGLRDESVASLHTMAQIIERESRALGSSPAEILRSDRRAVVCRVRFAVFAACHEAGFSSKEIGRYFDRDHTTVLHGIAKHKAGPRKLSSKTYLPVDSSVLACVNGHRSSSVLAA